MKKSIILLISFILVLLTGCVTNKELLYITYVEEGQLNFIKPTEIKTKNASIEKISIDATFVSSGNKIIKDTSVNYTITFGTLELGYEDCAVSIICGEELIALDNREIFFKEFTNKGKLDVRFSAKVKPEFFEKIMKSTDSVYIVIKYKDSEEIKLYSEELNKKINQARVVLL